MDRGMDGTATRAAPWQRAHSFVSRVVPRALRASARLVVRGVVGRWRRSVQLRVVSATVVLGIVVVLVVGQSLLSRISDDIVSSRQRAVVGQSKLDFATTQTDYQSLSTSSRSDLESKIQDTVNALAGPADQPTRYVILERALNSPASAAIVDRSSSGFAPGSIPGDLRQAVVRNPQEQQSKVFSASLDGRDVRVIAVGGLLDLGLSSGKYELYFVYSLDREVQIVDVVRRTFIFGGAALVLLIGAVAW